MSFIPKDWRDSSQDLTTPITAAALEDLEARLAAYTDAVDAATTVSGVIVGSYTLTDSDRVVRVSNATVGQHITLPTAVGRAGRRFTITKVNPFVGTYVCDLLTTASQTISGQAAPMYLRHAGDSITVVSDGANWIRAGGNLPTFRSSREWFVGEGGGSSGDGRTPHTAFNTFAQAIAAAGDGDTIWIVDSITEQIVINKVVRVIGTGNRAIVTIPSGATAFTDIGVKLTASGVVLENLEIRGHPAFKGIALGLDVAPGSTFVNLIISGCGPGGTPTAYPSSPGAGTGIGGIGIICHGGEGCYFEQLQINKCSIGFAIGEEASVGSINNAVVSVCVQELVIGLNTGPYPTAMVAGPFPYGGAISGGWTITNWKSTSSVTTTPRPPVVDLIGESGNTNYIGANGGSNTFIAFDASEGGLPIVRIGSAGNTFINPKSAPPAQWHIEGQRNHFINTRILGAGWVVSSDDNLFDKGWNAGCITGPGNRTHFRAFNFTAGPDLAFALTGSDNHFDDDCIFEATGGGALPAFADLGTRPSFNRREAVRALTYGTTIATDVRFGTYFTITATNGTGFTISNPIDTASTFDTSRIMRTNEISYRIRNSSGGAMGTITWGSQFKLDGALTNPANGANRVISFMRDGSDWVETGRSG